MTIANLTKTEKHLLPPSHLHVSSDTLVLSNAFCKTLVSSFKSVFFLYTSANLAANSVSSTSKIYLETNHILPFPRYHLVQVIIISYLDYCNSF